MASTKETRDKSNPADKSSQVEPRRDVASTVKAILSYALGSNEEEYDPYAHREKKHTTNYWESLAHLVKGCLGTGILAMPQGFSRAGLIPGLMLSLSAALLVTHCMHVLIRQSYRQSKVSRVPCLAYRDAAAWSFRRGPPSLRKFAKLFAIAVDFFLGFYHFGVCTVYILFIAECLKKLIDPITKITIIKYVLMLVLPITAISMVPNLKYFAPFSMAANVVTIVGVGIVLVFVLAWPPKSNSALDLWGSPAQYPLFFGTVLFALAAVGVLVAIENNMTKPQQFTPRLGVLNVGMGIVTTLYIIVSIAAYNFCRDKCSDLITLDLPPDSWLSTTVNSMFVIAIYISYGLNHYVPVDIIFRYVRARMRSDSTSKKIFIANYIVRVLVCIATFVLAASFPKVGLFISLFGAFCLSVMGIIFPAIMEALSSPKMPVFIKDILIIIIGLLVMITGTAACIESIVRTFTDVTKKSNDLF